MIKPKHLKTHTHKKKNKTKIKTAFKMLRLLKQADHKTKTNQTKKNKRKQMNK